MLRHILAALVAVSFAWSANANDEILERLDVIDEQTKEIREQTEEIRGLLVEPPVDPPVEACEITGLEDVDPAENEVKSTAGPKTKVGLTVRATGDLENCSEITYGWVGGRRDDFGLNSVKGIVVSKNVSDLAGTIALEIRATAGDQTVSETFFVKVLEDTVTPPVGPPDSEIIVAASLSLADVQAALDKVNAPNTIVQLPAGSGWGASMLEVRGEHCPHIRGTDWLPDADAYDAAIRTLLADAAAIQTRADREAASSLFQPVTRNVSFKILCEGAKLSRLDMVNLDINAPNSMVWYSRVDVLDYQHSHGMALFAKSRAGMVNYVSRNVGFGGADWEEIEINPGGTDMPYAQDVAFFPPVGVRKNSHAVDWSWQGGKGVVRDSVMVCGISSRATIRVHGFYRTDSGSRINSGRWFEAYRIKAVCEQALGWNLIDVYGGYGVAWDIDNRNKSNMVRISLEVLVGVRANQWNPTCDDLTMSKYPYPGQTAGSASEDDYGEGFYMWDLTHQGRPLDASNRNGLTFSCAASGPNPIIREGRDWHFGPRPGYEPLGAHPFEDRLS